jgi:hypothetical protein
MVAAPEYSLRTQAKIPLAIAALHNFIRLLDPDDDAEMDGDYDAGKMDDTDTQPINPDHLGSYISPAEKEQANTMRDTIARAMWSNYQTVLAEREE